MENKIPSFLLERQAPGLPLLKTSPKSSMGSSFVDKGLSYIAGVVKAGYIQWELASKKGFLQKFDPRAKLFLLFFFIGIISFKQSVYAEMSIGVFILVLAVFSGINVADFYKRVFLFAFFFGFAVALPASLNTITSGELVMRLVELPKPYDFWGYHIPRQIGITSQGLTGVIMLTLRVANSVALSLLVISTTPFPSLVKALKVLRVPVVFLMILTLTYKYIFIFAATIEDMYLAKKSRLVRRANGVDGRMWVAGRIAFIFKKTQLRCEEVFKAMLSRGFSDDIRFYGCRLFGTADRLFTLFILFAGTIICVCL